VQKKENPTMQNEHLRLLLG